MSAPTLRLACDAGAGIGFGHLMRCLALADGARARGVTARIHLAGDEAARAHLARERPDLAVARWEGPADLAACADGVVLDTRRPLDAELEAVHAAGGRSVVVDRLDHLARATWTLLPIPHPPPLRHPRLLAGRDFCVLAPELRALAPAPPAERDRILVSFGGADPLELTRRTAEPLQRALAWLPASERMPVHAVLGPGFRDAERVAAGLERLGWSVHEPLSRGDLYAFARRARFALTGYGTTVYDLAFLGVPCLYWTHHREDLDAAARLEAHGVGALAGWGGDVCARSLRARAAETILDPAWRRAAGARGRQAVGDGLGAARLLDRLLTPARGRAA